MKLQIAFDILDLSSCLDIAKDIENFADSFQLRPSLLLKNGIHAIEQFKEKFPNKQLFVETQIVNYPQDIVPMCLKAGADWVSVMAGSSKQVIHGVSTFANQKNKFVILDLTDTNLIGQAAMDAKKLGVDAIMYHTICNTQTNFSIEEWEDLKGNTNLPIFIDTHVDRSNIHFIMSLHPDVIIIGKSITQSSSPQEEASFYAQLLA